MSSSFWSRPAEEVLQHLQTGPRGLTAAVAAARLATVGPNRLRP